MRRLVATPRTESRKNWVNLAPRREVVFGRPTGWPGPARMASQAAKRCDIPRPHFDQDPTTMSGIADCGAFCAAILLFLALPGSGTTYTLTGSAGQGGLHAGVAATTGEILGDPTLMWLAVAGVVALLAAHPVCAHKRLALALQRAAGFLLAAVGLRLVRD